MNSTLEQTLKHITTIESPQWMFWVNRKAAFQSLGDMGETVNERAIISLVKVFCHIKLRKKWRYEASVALIRIGKTAVVALPHLRQFMTELDGERSDLGEIFSLIFEPIYAIGGVEAIGELLCKQELSCEIRLLVAEKLRSVDATPALPWLLKFLKHMNSIEENAGFKYEISLRIIEAIDKIGISVKSSVPDLVNIIEDLSRSKNKLDVRLEILSVLLKNIFPNWFIDRKLEWTDTTDIPNEFLTWWRDEGCKQDYSMIGVTKMATRAPTAQVDTQQAKTSGGFLLLLLPPDVEGVDIVRTAAKQVGFTGGAIKVMNGSSNITQGNAEALLARIDASEGTAYLSRNFKWGIETISGKAYGYILVK